MRDLLLEIGCENLPASYVAPALEQLKADAESMMNELRLGFESVTTTGTPRRLVLFVEGLAGVQEARVEAVTGPPVSKAFDEKGRPTKAAIGFAKSKGVSVKDLRRIETDRGEYVGFERRLSRRKAVALLRENLPALVGGLRFPKSMRWQSGKARFARPVRWIVCLYGDTVVRFKFAGVGGSNVSFRSPWLSREKIVIRNAESYLSTMKKRGIIVDHRERRERLLVMALRAARKAGCELVEDEDLLDEINFMLEEPGVFVGEFPPDYLSLPPEVVITAMKTHQRYFALRRSGNGELMPRFLAFYDGKKRSSRGIKAGNEKVLRARLQDALFYWKEDLKRGIHALADRLDGIVFMEGLGTLREKAERLEKLLCFFDRRGGTGLSEAEMHELALLAKADLASEMVRDGKEFTLLEGVIGSYYARAAGKAAGIVRAIREHHLPRSSADPLPSSRAGMALSLADKMDNICGCFLAGLLPSGSQDPYALRRQALAVIRMIDRSRIARLDELMNEAVAIYREAGLPDNADYDESLGRLEDFFKGRLEGYLLDAGYDYDIVDAVLPLAWLDPRLAAERCRSFQRIRKKKDFKRLIAGVKRVGNILSSERKIFGSELEKIRGALFERETLGVGVGFRESLFQEAEERELNHEVKEMFSEIEALEKAGDFPGILKTFSRLAPAIDRYFDKVLVNCKDKEVSMNRHGFLAVLFALFSRYADFSYIVDSDQASS